MIFFFNIHFNNKITKIKKYNIKLTFFKNIKMENIVKKEKLPKN
jgi:hypothetical protein